MCRRDAWGAPETPLIAPFGFTGELQQCRDVWLRARWYGAGRGSFGGRDPYVGDAETPYSMQYYQYAYSAPTVWIDPGGDTPCAPNPGIPVGNCGGGGGARGPGEPMGPTTPKPYPPGTAPYAPRIPRPEDGGGTGPGSLPPRNQPDVGGAGKGVSIGGVVMLLVGGAICLWEQLHADPAPQPQHPTPPQPSPTPDTNGKHYVQSDGITIKIGFDARNAHKEVKLGYEEYLARSIPRGYSIQTGWFWSGLASQEDQQLGWWPELVDALQNTQTINFVVDGMDVINNPARLKAPKVTHQEMDYILQRGYTQRLHLWQNQQEITGIQRLQWIQTWKSICGIP